MNHILCSITLAALPLNPERIGQCALHFFWQGTLIAGGLAFLLTICRRGTPHLRYVLCGLALLLMVASPLVTWQQMDPGNSPGHPESALREKRTNPTSVEGFLENESGALGVLFQRSHPERMGNSPNAASGIATDPSGSARSARWNHWIGYFWIGGALGIAFWRLLGLLGTRKMIQRSVAAGNGLTDRVRVLAERCSLRCAPAVKITGRLVSPAVAGILKPVLLIPAGALTGLSPRELDFVLAHELAHVRRQDFLLGLLQTAAETLLFFHPAAWWVSHRMNLEREQACDDDAIRLTGDRRAGATALARLAELSLGESVTLAPAAAGGNLLARVRRLLDPTPIPRAKGLLILLPLATVALMIPLTLVSAVQSRESSPPAPAAATLQNRFRGSILDRHGVVLAESVQSTRQTSGKADSVVVRKYPLGATTSHVLGYLKTRAGGQGMETGAAGIEGFYNDILSSTPVAEGKGQAGLVLTLDARIQQICRKALLEAGVGRGAVVIQDVSNGGILAMTSVPDFDSNQLVTLSDGADFTSLDRDPTAPLANRALGAVPPGSVFKLVTALAARQSGKGQNSYECTGTVVYEEKRFQCWTVQQSLPGHGMLQLDGALKSSCNCWFYQLGNDIGPDPIGEMAALLGIGQATTLVLLDGDHGFVPTREWWEKQNKGPWTAAKTANLSIGQGEVQATPLQMAGVAAAVASQGKVWKQRLVLKSRVDGNWKENLPEVAHDLVAGGVPAAGIALIRQGMVDAVRAGTGKPARSNVVSMAGKTGTAQKYRYVEGSTQPVPDNHAWFVGYAPADEPKYAFAVLVANGRSGGSVCAPIARRIMESIEWMNQGKLLIQPKPEIAAKGHFKAVDAVQLPEDAARRNR